jgi:hypothetical protein
MSGARDASLVFGVDAGGFLVVRARSESNVAAVQFSPAGVQLLVTGLPPVQLPWDANLPIRFDGPAVVPDSWSVTYYVTARSFRGVAVQVTGRLRDDGRALLEATNTLARRLGRALDWNDGDVPIPIVTGPRNWFSANEDERVSTLAALVELLRRRPELRERLGDPGRMEALAHTLQNGLLGLPNVGDGMTRDVTDARVALRMAGYVHPLGRPPAPGLLDPLEVVMRRTLERLDANPHRTGRVVDLEWLEEIVRRSYYDIAPWPFEPLVR